jgi:hypothetical protein
VSGNPPVKHHYTPRFLLHGWTGDDGKLWRFTSPYPGKIATKRVAPAEIGYQKHLYSIPGAAPDKAQAIEEKFMSALDDQAADAHKLLLQGKVALPQKLRSAWSRFLMSQWFRTPEGVGHMKQAMASLLAKDDPALFAKYEALKKEDYPPSLDEAIALLDPHFAEHAALQVMMKLMDNPTNGHRLNNMQWFVREVAGGHDLLVSDKLLQMSHGIFSDSGYLTMPLSPLLMFCAVKQPSRGKPMMAMGRNEFVSRANRAVVRRAAEYIGATDVSQAPFIEKHFGKDDHPTLIGALAKRYADGEVAGSSG